MNKTERKRVWIIELSYFIRDTSNLRWVVRLMRLGNWAVYYPTPSSLKRILALLAKGSENA